MTRMLYLTILTVIMLAGMMAVVSCGSSPQPAPQPTETNPVPAAVEIEIANLAFSPATVTVAAGTTVTWTNKDSVPHTATSRTPLFDSGKLDGGGKFSYTFNQKGTFEYYCTFHPNMAGKVIVQ